MTEMQLAREDVLSVADAAALLHVHKDTVRRLFDLGRLAGYRTSDARGSWRRIYRSSVEEMIRTRVVG